MGKPIIEMSDEIKNMACKLYKAAKEIGLGNISFKYSNTSGYDEITVYIDEYREHWECNVVKYNYDGNKQCRTLDMYHIDENGLYFKGSEVD